MHKARLPRQADLDDAVQTFASSPGGMSESDPAYFGYWSREEALKFLRDLLEAERVGLTAFAAIGRAADLGVADLVFKSELAQGAICVLLKKEIARRKGAQTVSPKDNSLCAQARTQLPAHDRIRTQQSDQAGRHD